jgi:hypothetical protein
LSSNPERPLLQGKQDWPGTTQHSVLEPSGARQTPAALEPEEHDAGEACAGDAVPEGTVISYGDIRQIAGLLEGEDCFTLQYRRRDGHHYVYPRLLLNMTDRDVVEKAAALVGAKVGVRRHPNRPKWKDAYWFNVSGSRAIAWMQVVYQFMGQRRRERIREILSMLTPSRAKAGSPSGWVVHRERYGCRCHSGTGACQKSRGV